METKLRKEGFENDEASISVRIQQCTGDRGREIPGGRCNFCAEHTKAGKLDEDTYPEPVAIYAVDNRRGLHKEYLESVKTKDFTKHVEFADIINREGILIQ